jgi:hypothetical protein
LPDKCVTLLFLSAIIISCAAQGSKNMCISALVLKSVNSQEIAKTIRNVLERGM